jgi:assimilatory nitrate reductase catalytic subunit
VLRSLSSAEAYVEISPEDASARKLATGDWTEVVSPRGTMRARARVTPIVAAGQVFVPMHYAHTNRLTNASFDPHSRQPSYKSGAVEVRRARRRHR